MPDPNDFQNMDEFMGACVPQMIGEGKPKDQAVAACMGMWNDKMSMKYRSMDFIFATTVKAVGDNELDVLAAPFNRKDADQQYFDANTDVMPDSFQTPVAIYQHGITQGAKGIQPKPVVLGKTRPGTLEKRSDGWHVNVVLDQAVALAKNVMEAAKRGTVAVSSGSVAHLARLDVGGRLIPYEKNRAGRIAVWPIAEVSLWELGNGNVQPASRFAVAMPVMKAIYRDAGLVFPEITDADGNEAEATRRARIEQIQEKTRKLLAKVK